MPCTIAADGLSFCFPDGWEATKFDDWAYYRNQFSKAHKEIKAVDILALSPDKATLWLIEVKDFRAHPRTKSIPLQEEIWNIVFDTLAALLPAGVHATGHEQQFARAAGRVKNIRVVFHGEQPVKHRSLFPQSYTPADIQQKFKALFKAIDPRALVVSSRTMPARIPWTVQP